MLMCHAKGCTSNNFPLRIEEAEVESLEAEFNEGFMRRLLTKLDWDAFVQTAFALGVDQLPPTMPEVVDEAMLQRLHKIALETRVKEGRMVCPNCGHVYPIRDGIPNMLLQETEV
ncbi:hypothetical protein HDV05_004500 [Chytridiales sp. JEL 0842]|nr:hypothetical protein HDV05_004500 [Chytridiales sp. JEL 0842]